MQRQLLGLGVRYKSNAVARAIRNSVRAYSNLHEELPPRPRAAKNLDDLVKRLRDALADPNPPNNYVDALAKSAKPGEEPVENRSILRRRPLKERFPKSMYRYRASNNNEDAEKNEEVESYMSRAKGYKEFKNSLVDHN